MNSLLQQLTQSISRATTTIICAGAFAVFSTTAWADDAKETLTAYESVSKALLADDLAAAQAAAGNLASAADADSALAKHATALQKSTSLESARDHFKAVSDEAIKLAEGKDGYHVMTCPMVEGGDWLQTSEKVANPYMGKKMPACGMKKKDASA